MSEKCEYCGHNLEPQVQLNDLSEHPIQIIGWKCTNPDCSNPQKEWTLADHEDSETWLIQTMRQQQAEIETLKLTIGELTQSIITLKTEFTELLSKLEQTLEIDLNGDGTVGSSATSGGTHS